MTDARDDKSNNVAISVGGDYSDAECQRELKLEDVTPKLTKWFFQYPHLLKLNIFLGCALFGMVTQGYDGTLMGNLQTIPTWNSYFNNPSGERLSTLSNGQVFGSIASVPFLVIVGDRIGRKHMLLIGVILSIVGAGIQAGAVNYGMFLTSRIVLGLGSGATQVSSAPLLAETAYPSQRPAITSMMQASFPAGAFLAALFVYAGFESDLKYNDWSWRMPSVLQGACPIIQLVLVFFCPESPRWLIAHNKEDEAFEVLTKYHAGGDRNSELVKFEMAEIKAAIANEQSGRKVSWLTWFQTKANFHRLFLTIALPTIIQLCGSSLVSYYFSIVLEGIGYTNPVEKLKINIGYTVFGGVFGVVAALYSGNVKRRILMLGSLGLMLITFVIWTILSAVNEQTNQENKSLGRGIVAVMYFHSGFYHMLSPIGNTYVMEVVPYTLRGKAALVYSLSSQAWVLFNNYVNNLGLDSISWRYYIVFCVWLFVHMVVIYFFFPETKGLGLEEMAQIFGEDITDLTMDADNAIIEPREHDLKSQVDHIESVSPQNSANVKLSN
ncbi:DEHA2D00440p [Debaryomyces hansenii CBS767]|uniref:DEHA2D00440p n=1 Tax=Debaryomyces hansenii (strain ATCC 36239 / CBS 767 / BCRC 21394 / JCM 1990 / NBRC 0083 / IGC 2968) TaxID=284592 RepID=B5RTP8_DEBHA|nr:DEHA2D00440p [Debaryomyces hansenii CBS767]CAR65604.1 DEHA2D00440p [Debaryomyces hansenii CBS767]|eukprot:XP_002770242.1 DEHA2D00440p [Debaryomyces hansenii CBS767]